MAAVPKQGSETRSTILPNMTPQGLGFFGSPYNPADAMLTPNQLGIKNGDSIGDVVQAVKGVGFYVDQIGFGAPSTGLTNGMPLKPLGVNYFMKTGVTCSNGAEMWEYVKGITEGDALGSKVQNAMRDMGLPPLQGLAPGMIEDAKHALDPNPLMSSLFGTGYPQCRLVELPVGDSSGHIVDPDTGEEWISDVPSAYRAGGGYRQRKWVVDQTPAGQPVYLSRDDWVSAEKTHHKDGTPIRAEGFLSSASGYREPATMIVVGVLCLLAFGMLRRG